MIICVSGFLSEQGDYAQSWENLVTECRSRNIPLYTVQWEAKGMQQMENMCLDQAKQNLAPILSGNKGWGSLFSSENLSKVGTFLAKTSD